MEVVPPTKKHGKGMPSIQGEGRALWHQSPERRKVLDSFWRPGAEVEVRGGGLTLAKVTSPPWGPICHQSVVTERAGILVFKVQVKNPSISTYLLCDTLQVTWPLCACISSSVKWAQRWCLSPRSQKEQ